MLLKALEVVHYPETRLESGESWETLMTPTPPWAFVEASIRRLDRRAYPYLYLHAAEPVEGEPPSHALNILGGEGEYALSLWLSTGILYYSDPTRGDAPVTVWETDQGSVQRASDLCNDLATVIRIARHFAETGTEHPDATWRE